MVNADGTQVSGSPQGYMPWGETRFGSVPTSYQYTGQFNDSYIKLMWYGSRWYDSELGRFSQPDNIIPEPGNTLAWDRYSYAANNPVRYRDPSGHWIETLLDIAFIGYDLYQISQEGWTPVNAVALAADVACAIAPVATGGGPAVRGGVAIAEATTTTVTHLPEAIRAAQAAEKLFQFIEGDDHSQSPFTNLKPGTEVNKGGINPDRVYLSDKKSGQAAKRGWTLDSIRDAVTNPAETRSNPNIVNRANNNPVTYYYRADGYYVVIDNITGEVVQISDTYDPVWIDEMTNEPITPIH
jgi:RHS repeat-associated protein